MYFSDKDYELTDENIILIVTASMESFGQGIYVPCDYHICGYDFIDFECIELDEEDEDFYEEYSPLNYKFEGSDISNGIYDSCHPYEGLTLKEILQKTNLKFEFERN